MRVVFSERLGVEVFHFSAHFGSLLVDEGISILLDCGIAFTHFGDDKVEEDETSHYKHDGPQNPVHFRLSRSQNLKLSIVKVSNRHHKCIDKPWKHLSQMLVLRLQVLRENIESHAKEHEQHHEESHEDPEVINTLKNHNSDDRELWVDAEEEE